MKYQRVFRTLGAQDPFVLERYIQCLPYAAQGVVLDNLPRGINNVAASLSPDRGDPAPQFGLRDTRGRIHSLIDYRKPLVLSFFLGAWSEPCIAALSALQGCYAEIAACGGEVIAIAPNSPAQNRHTAMKARLKFPLLSDSNNRVADCYGLRSDIAPILEPVYKEFGVEFPEDCDRLDVPYPATFILNTSLVIEQAFIDRDPRVRMPARDIVDELRRIGGRSSKTPQLPSAIRASA